ncbi:30S ribosomal protein S7 [Candidatus Pacearchaeota archaeon CG10_big_fil_rev_8_21_14_0_10_34_76]|nr:MAG: 30S ribosomal protein S7 [Candidatus Pacearchaeota archaeon CG10_big_fil_rev_8_21_14_0_10_34_76]
MKLKIFGMYDVEEIQVSDVALKPYINIDDRLLVKSHGRNLGKFTSARVNILERLANRISVPGHVGKKHRIITSWASGKYNTNMKTVVEVLKIIENKKKDNPLQILVKAIESCSPRDEITTIEYGGARYPQAVDVSPSRRVNLAIRWLVQGAYQKSFGKKRKMAETLANEIILASEGNMESYAMQKKNESEKQADAAR